ncbi:MAG: hypothetical protein CMJ23_05735 [Phycisphaerae bacterium]|nr:hypothetical protein [Phycisphaerae bacterium]
MAAFLASGHRMNPPSSSANQAHTLRSSNDSAPFAWVPFLLGLVLPGLGHAWIGEKGRGLRIAIGFVVLWFGGLLIGGIDSVSLQTPAYATQDARPARRLWFLPQAGAGPIAFATAIFGDVVRPDGEDDLITITMPDKRPGKISDSTSMGHALDFGTLFCALAGLMNIAIALDAGRRNPDDRRRSSR